MLNMDNSCCVISSFTNIYILAFNKNQNAPISSQPPAQQCLCIISVKSKSKGERPQLHSLGSLCHLEEHRGDSFYAAGTIFFVAQG